MIKRNNMRKRPNECLRILFPAIREAYETFRNKCFVFLFTRMLWILPYGTACVNFMNDKMIIGGVATSLKYRGKGYGKLALEKVLHTVNSNCYLFVCNPIALNMYKSMGFYTICTWDRVL